MNAYDAGFQNKIKFVEDQLAAKQQRDVNDYKLKRQPVLDQQADADRQLALADDQKARDAAAATAQRQAQLRGLMTLKTAVDKGMDPGKAIAALGPGGLKAFGDTFGDMAGFAVKAKQPGFLDAQIAGLRGDADPKRVFKQDFVQKPDGTKGVLLTYADGTQQFSSDYQDMPNSGGSRAALKRGDDGQWRDPYTGAVVAADDLALVAQMDAAQKLGQGLGTSQSDAIIKLPQVKAQTGEYVRAIDAVIADPALDSILGAPDLQKLIGQGGLGGLTQWINIQPPGSPAAEAAAKLEYVGSQAFLKGIQALKGFGPVTEKEGEAAKQAVANLSRLRNPAEIKQELQRLSASLKNYYAALEQEAGGAYTGVQAPGPGAPRGGGAPDPQAVAPAPKKSAKYY